LKYYGIKVGNCVDSTIAGSTLVCSVLSLESKSSIGTGVPFALGESGGGRINWKGGWKFGMTRNVDKNKF